MKFRLNNTTLGYPRAEVFLLTSDVNDFDNATSHSTEKPLLAALHIGNVMEGKRGQGGARETN